MIAATPFFSDRGCHIRIYNEIKYLEKNDFDVTLCTYHLGYNPPGIRFENIRRIMNVPWYKKITPGASWHKVYLDFLLFVLAWRTFLKLRPKIIHAHLYEGLLIAWFVKIFSFSSVKIVFDCQGSLAEEMVAYTLHKSKLLKLSYWIFVFIEKMLLNIPTKIVCSSKNSFHFLLEKYRISHERISVLDDGVDTDLFKLHSEEEKVELRKTLGIPENRIVILYTGSMTQAKGVGELLDVVPAILKENDTIMFVFAGYGGLEDVYKERYGSLIENRGILFIGRFSYFDLSRYIAIADYAIDPKNGSSESSGKMYYYVAGGLRVICFENAFNQTILGDAGMYINRFSDISSLDFKKSTSGVPNQVSSWRDLVGKLLGIYESV